MRESFIKEHMFCHEPLNHIPTNAALPVLYCEENKIKCFFIKYNQCQVLCFVIRKTQRYLSMCLIVFMNTSPFVFLWTTMEYVHI